MAASGSKSVVSGVVAGVVVTAFAGMLMGQGANQPVKSEAQYFVTADGEGAHLWVREGATLRVVAHGACKECEAKGHEGHDHKEGDGHDHSKDAPKK
ncbi:MAG: hypothetical protein ACOYN0_19300 [Phycisphaerales bacterium]